MSDYTKITDYAAKDALVTGNPAKLVKGTELGADFDAVATAVATKADTTSPTLVTPNIGVATGTSLQAIIGNVTPAAGTFTTLTSTGNAALGDAEATDTHAVKGATTLLTNSSSAALTITQTGSGNALVVEDSTSPDSTPFVIDADGDVIVGHTSQIVNFGGLNQDVQIHGLNANSALGSFAYVNDATSSGGLYLGKSRNTAIAKGVAVQNGDRTGVIYFGGDDGTDLIRTADIISEVDGTPGTNSMPGRLIFRTTADGASIPTERMRIDSSGNVGINATPSANSKLTVSGSSSYSAAFSNSSGAAYETTWSHNQATTGDNKFIWFYTEASATSRGGIDYNRAGGLVRYNTSSDVTLKNIIGDADTAKSVALLENTRIREYSWKDDPTNKPQIGVIAQEVHAAGFEGAVSVGGEYTEKDEDGNDVTKYRPWAVDKTAWTFHLIAGFQAQQKLIAQLEARIAALEASHVGA